MNPYIMLGVAILLLVLAIIRSIEWRKLALKWVGYNPDRAQVYVKSGSNIAPAVLGVRDKENPNIYHYREFNATKGKTSITLPDDYPHENLYGRRLIGVADGKAVASPFGFMSAADLVKYRESKYEVSVLAQGQAVVKALKSIAEVKPFNWNWIIIIAIGGAAIFWFMNGQGKPAEVAEPVTPPASINQTIEKTPGDNIILVPNEPGKVVP